MIDKALKEEIKLNFKINEKQIPKFLLKKNLFANFSYATRNDLIRFTLKYQITKKEFKALYKKALIDDEYINCLVKFCFVNSYNFTSLKLFEKQIPANCLKNSYFINAYHDNYVIIDKFLSYLKNERDITEKLNLLIINSKLVEKYMNSSKLDVIYNNLEILPMLDRLCMIKGNKDINYYLENYTPMQIKKLCTLMTQVPAQNYELQQYIFRNYENIDSSYLDYLSTINYDFHQALKNENYSSLTQHFISFVLNEHLYQDINQSLTFLKSCYLDKKTAWQLDEILKDIDINKLSLEDKNIINYYNLIKQNNDKDKLQNLDEKFFQKLVKVCSAYRNIQYNENLLNSQDLNNFLTVTHKTVMTKDNKVKPVKVIELQGEFYKAYVHNIVNKNNNDSSISLNPQQQLSENLIHNPELWNNSEGVNYVAGSLVSSSKMALFAKGTVTMGFAHLNANQAIATDAGTSMEKGASVKSSLNLANVDTLLQNHPTFEAEAYNEVNCDRDNLMPDYFLCLDNNILDNGCAPFNLESMQFAAYFDKPIILIKTQSYYNLYKTKLEEQLTTLKMGTQIPKQQLDEVLILIKQANQYTNDKISYYDVFKQVVDFSINKLNADNVSSFQNLVKNYLKPSINFIDDNLEISEKQKIIADRQLEVARLQSIMPSNAVKLSPEAIKK